MQDWMGIVITKVLPCSHWYVSALWLLNVGMLLVNVKCYSNAGIPCKVMMMAIIIGEDFQDGKLSSSLEWSDYCKK